jgi:hypothetical protein
MAREPVASDGAKWRFNPQSAISNLARLILAFGSALTGPRCNFAFRLLPSNRAACYDRRLAARRIVSEKKALRPVLVVALAVLIFGVLAAYERFVATLPEREMATHDAPPATEHFSLELQLSFVAAQDAFTLPDDPSLLVRLGEHDLVCTTERVSANAPLKITEVPGIVAGKNAFYVRATPADDAIRQACAARLTVLRDGQTLAEQTLWSSPGDIVSGEVLLDIADDRPSDAAQARSQ